jgi:hypothetical protein
MPGDITKNVRTKYWLDAKQLVAVSKKIERRMRKVARVADKVTKKIGAMGRMLAAPAGLGLAGAAGLVKHLVDVGREAQDAELQITGLLQGVSKSSNLPLAGFERARMTAAKLRQEFIRLAQDSPIAAKDVREAFEIAVFPLSRAGLSLQQQAEFARGVAIADLSNVVKGTTAADIRQLFQGISNPRMIQTGLLKPIARQVADLSKKGDFAQAAKVISEQLRPDPKLLKAYSTSASGMIATLGDKLKLIKEKIAGPLLDFLVAKTSEWGDWLDKNQDRVAEIAKDIGKGIVKGVKAIISAVKFLAKHWNTILTVVKTLAAVWIAGKLVSGLSSLISLASKFGQVLGNAMGRTGGIKGASLLKGAGAIGLAVAAAEHGEDIGVGAAKLFSSEATNKKIAAAEAISARIGPSMTKAEYKRFMAGMRKKPSQQKTEDDALKAQLDPTKVKRKRAGGGGGTRVKKMSVDKLEVKDRDFARTSSKFVTGIRRESRATRQIAGLGLGAGAVGVGVR